MKTLYFDVDGTILLEDEGVVKPELAAGRFEAAVRAAGFERLVCVGNFGAIADAMGKLGLEYDALGVLYDLCDGAFRDEAWLRSVTTLIGDPRHRAEHIDYAGDWWYLDDLARAYLESSGRQGLYEEHAGRRLLAPDPQGDGGDVLEWLSNSSRTRTSGRSR